MLTYSVVSSGFINNGPECRCGNKDWFVGEDIVRCSYCDRSRDVNLQGYIVGGPECRCNNTDWFIGETVYRCSYCERTR